MKLAQQSIGFICYLSIGNLKKTLPSSVERQPEDMGFHRNLLGIDASQFPMDDHTWQTIATLLKLSNQQTRIVELILINKEDAEIASMLKLKVPTIRTYLTRIFEKAAVSNRLALILRIFYLAMTEGKSIEKRGHKASR